MPRGPNDASIPSFTSPGAPPARKRPAKNNPSPKTSPALPGNRRSDAKGAPKNSPTKPPAKRRHPRGKPSTDRGNTEDTFDAFCANYDFPSGSVRIQDILIPGHRIFPPPSLEDRVALHASLRDNGVQQPIIVDQRGNLIDGFERLLFCAFAGIWCPRVVEHMESDETRYEKMVTYNLGRRNLDRKGKEQVVENYLRVDPTVNGKWLADMLGGTSPAFVTRTREKLVSTGQIPPVSKVRCRDGKMRPARYAIAAHSPREHAMAQKIISDMPEPSHSRTIDTQTARGIAMRQKAKAMWSQEIQAKATRLPPSVRIEHCPFQEMLSRQCVEPESVDLVVTDIPYGKDFLPELNDLTEFIRGVLKPSGAMAIMCGSYYFDHTMRAFTDVFDWYWLFRMTWSSRGHFVPERKLLSRGHPIIVLSKDEKWTPHGQVCDVIHSEAPEKSSHPWQHPVADFARLVKLLSSPNDLICDPCAGSFTTALACLEEGRRLVGCDREERWVHVGRQRVSDWLEAHQLAVHEKTEVES